MIWSDTDSTERIYRKLELAGNPPGWTVDVAAFLDRRASMVEFAHRILGATGFRKWGMTNGTAAAMVLTGALTGYAADHFDITTGSFGTQVLAEVEL